MKCVVSTQRWQQGDGVGCGGFASARTMRSSVTSSFFEDQNESCASRFRVQGSGFKVQGSGFRVQGSGFRVQGAGFRVEG